MFSKFGLRQEGGYKMEKLQRVMWKKDESQDAEFSFADSPGVMVKKRYQQLTAALAAEKERSSAAEERGESTRSDAPFSTRATGVHAKDCE
jgi:hypothetical protein